jgi:putative membrane protein
MGYGYGPHWGFMGGGGFGLGPIVWIVILIAIVAAIVWLVRSLGVRDDRQMASPRRSPGLDVLEERYARGEINREEYLQKKNDILGRA